MDLVSKPSSYSSSSGSWKATVVVSGQFPAGLRVLVVDDDPTCLRILEKMLRNCLYEVTTCNRAEIALKFLRENKNGYDIVISDVHMPDMDGFKLLEHVGLEMDLPVIMMSADDSKHVVMKGVTHGACDYLIKPVRMEALKNMWQHVVRKKKKKKNGFGGGDFEPPGSAENGEKLQKSSPDGFDFSSSRNLKNSKKRKDEEEEEDEDAEEEREEASTSKKPRVVWSVELHQQFVNAVNHLGIDRAVPKKILELMSVHGLTRENVASHLQKYRLYLRRLSSGGTGNSSFVGPTDMTFGGPLTSVNGIYLRALAASGCQLPPRSLTAVIASNSKTPLAVDQRNIFCFENPNLRYFGGGGQQQQQQQQSNQSTNRANLLHGIPTNMDPKHLGILQKSFGSVNVVHMQREKSHSNLLHSPAKQSLLSQQNGGIENVCGLNSYSSVSKLDLSRTRDLEFPGNNGFDPRVAADSGTSNLTSNKLQDRVFVSGYDVFGGLNPIKNQDWSLRHTDSMVTQMGFSFDRSSGLSTFSGPEGHANNPVFDRSINPSSTADDSLRIRTERLPDMGFQNGVFDERYGQEDLTSAMLKQQETVGASDREFGLDGYHLDNLAV